MKFVKSQNSQVIKRKNQIIPRLIITLLIIIVVFFTVFFISRKIIKKINSVPSITKVYEQWDNGNYLNVYDFCNLILTEKPFDSTALAYRGYSAFTLAISQSDLDKSNEYIDISINSLRLALKDSSKSITPQINYMLGKAYFHKNSLSAYYYYADSAVYYLNEAIKLGFSAPDIPKYLGLCYAQLSMTEESIRAFSEALLTEETDELLMAIAKQYIKNEQSETAKQYLYRIRNISKDEIMIIEASQQLASIYIEEGNFDEALKEYNVILEKDPYNADAFYGKGVVYENLGDMVKARAEWRNALKVQVNHPGALKKLS